MSAFVVFRADGNDEQAEIYLPGYASGFLLKKTGNNEAGTWTGDSLVLNYWKGMYILEGKSGIVLYQGMATSTDVSETDARQLLQGKWQSVEDAKSVFEIQNGYLTNFYDGKKLDKREFNFVADCKTNACPGAASNFGCFTSAGKMDIDCFSIVSITKEMLETSLAGGAGKTLHYKKIQ